MDFDNWLGRWEQMKKAGKGRKEYNKRNCHNRTVDSSNFRQSVVLCHQSSNFGRGWWLGKHSGCFCWLRARWPHHSPQTITSSHGNIVRIVGFKYSHWTRMNATFLFVGPGESIQSMQDRVVITTNCRLHLLIMDRRWPLDLLTIGEIGPRICRILFFQRHEDCVWGRQVAGIRVVSFPSKWNPSNIFRCSDHDIRCIGSQDVVGNIIMPRDNECERLTQSWFDYWYRLALLYLRCIV